MITLWMADEKPIKKEPPPLPPDFRPTVVFEMDYEVVDDKGEPLGPVFTVSFTATGDQWGADDEESDEVRTLEDLYRYLSKEAQEHNTTIGSMLEDWDFSAYNHLKTVRARLKED